MSSSLHEDLDPTLDSEEYVIVALEKSRKLKSFADELRRTLSGVSGPRGPSPNSLSAISLIAQEIIDNLEAAIDL